MKRLTVLFASACLLVLALAGVAVAQPPTSRLSDVSAPTVSAILPAAAPNDRDTPVVVSGSGFLSGATATLGTTPLTTVVVVSDTTLTATVPQDLTPGLYDLTVTNPDTGTATLSGAFTVTLPPSLSGIAPASAYNDLDTTVTISGSDFASTPTVSLGSTALTNVALANSTTLTATVPWGMDPGTYDLTVTNPDCGNSTLTGAYTVQAGIGQWNRGDLFGGQIAQLFMKPGDPDTLYATAPGVVGLFRSDDAGDHWAVVSDKVWGNGSKIAVDPLHPDWLYLFASGLMRSTDEGDTWTTLTDNQWPDGSDLNAYPQVYVSPYEDATHPQALFISSCEGYVIPPASGPKGLIKSTDGGASWTIVPSLAGVPVQDVAFDPNDPSKMVLVTSDMQVYTSSDWGDSWTQVTTTGLTPSTLGFGGSITYNSGGSEVWINASAQPVGGGIFKSAASDLTSWQEVSPSPGYGSSFLTFTGATSAYISRFHSTDGGTSWNLFGPSPWYGPGAFAFDPADPQTAYIANDAVGVQKTTDLLDPTPTWQDAVQGLTALSCSSMAVSPSEPLQVYAAFYGPLGICRSDRRHQQLELRADPRGLAAAPGPGRPLRLAAYLCGSRLRLLHQHRWRHELERHGMEPVPVLPGRPRGHGSRSLPGRPSAGQFRYRWRSTPAVWQHRLRSDLAGRRCEPGPRPVFARLHRLRPGDAGDRLLRNQRGLQKHRLRHNLAAHRRSQATRHGHHGGDRDRHPSAAHTDGRGPDGYLYRSVDGGATWQKAASTAYGGVLVFVDGDSTRLYRATAQGLFFSSDAGDSWQQAAGVIGQVQTTALGYADTDGHTILYAATNGGQAGTSRWCGRCVTPARCRHGKHIGRCRCLPLRSGQSPR